MKKLYVFSLFLFVSTLCLAQAQILHVKAGGHGNGSSWENSMGNLAAALRVARAGDQIWVAAGEYRPTTGNDRFASFTVPEGVQLLGGFAGFETSVDQRNIERNLTILSGEIGSASQDDNSFTVLYTKNVSSATLIDGFTIAYGAANGMGAPGDPKRCGGGWFNDGSLGASNPTVQNCIFRDNIAFDGAAFYNFAKNGTASPMISYCAFVGNRAQLDGGAIFNDAAQGNCNPAIEFSLIQNNQANYGAGMMNQAANGEARPELRNCQFLGNASLIRGSGVYNNRLESGICSPNIKACIFEDNVASVGEDYRRTYNNLIASEKAVNSANSSAGYR